MKHIVPHWGPEMQYDAVCSCTVAEIDEAIPIRIYPRAVDPRAEREAKPHADESGARRGRQVGGRRPGEGVCAADGARSSRRHGRGRRRRRRRRRRRWWRADRGSAHSSHRAVQAGATRIGDVGLRLTWLSIHPRASCWRPWPHPRRRAWVHGTAREGRGYRNHSATTDIMLMYPQGAAGTT